MITIKTEDVDFKNYDILDAQVDKYIIIGLYINRENKRFLKRTNKEKHSLLK
jgi:hypothetical protein